MSHVLSTLAIVLATGVSAAALAAELVPGGTLRATFISTNPVQAKTDPATGEVKGPAADLARELGRRLGVPVTIKGAQGVNGVLASVKNGEADIGFLAYDPVRAKEVDYSQTYALAQNTYLVLDGSPLRSISEIDRAGMRIGVTEGDTADLVLTRTLKNAELWRNKGGDMEAAFRALQAREIAAYATNRQRLHELSQLHAGLRMLRREFLRRRTIDHRQEGQHEAARDRADIPRRRALIRSRGVARSRAPASSGSMSRRRAISRTAPSRRIDLKEPSARVSLEHHAAARGIAGDRLYRPRQSLRGRPRRAGEGPGLHADRARVPVVGVQLGVHGLAVARGTVRRLGAAAAVLSVGRRRVVARDRAVQRDDRVRAARACSARSSASANPR